MNYDKVSTLINELKPLTTARKEAWACVFASTGNRQQLTDIATDLEEKEYAVMTLINREYHG